MLKAAALILAILAVSIGMLPLEAASGPLSDFVEQNFVALSLVLLIPLLMPWME